MILFTPKGKYNPVPPWPQYWRVSQGEGSKEGYGLCRVNHQYYAGQQGNVFECGSYDQQPTLNGVARIGGYSWFYDGSPYIRRTYDEVYFFDLKLYREWGNGEGFVGYRNHEHHNQQLVIEFFFLPHPPLI